MAAARAIVLLLGAFVLHVTLGIYCEFFLGFGVWGRLVFGVAKGFSQFLGGWDLFFLGFVCGCVSFFD